MSPPARGVTWHTFGNLVTHACYVLGLPVLAFVFFGSLSGAQAGRLRTIRGYEPSSCPAVLTLPSEMIILIIVESIAQETAQETSASLEAMFLPFIESVPDAMVMSDTDGDIVLVNTNTEKLFGYPRGEILGKNVELLVPARFKAPHRRHRASYYSDPSIRPMGIGREVSARGKDGGEFRVEIYLSPVHIWGKLFVWSTIRDISEREALFNRVRSALTAQGIYRALVSVCAWCRRVRDERGPWQGLDQYAESNWSIEFSHGICQDCLQRLEPAAPQNRESSHVGQSTARRRP